MAITNTAFEQASCILGVSKAVIQAVSEVESGGSGFVGTQPKILYEPHVFFQQLVLRGIDVPKVARHAATKHICYKAWRTYPYAKGNAANHERLNLAAQIHREAALSSCSWGKYQIMGYHFKKCGCATIQDFVNAMYKSEDEHLRLFINFILNTGLTDELQRRDWAAFARQYNGASYAVNKYDQKLAAAYKKYSS